MNELAVVKDTPVNTVVTPMDMLQVALKSGANLEQLKQLMDLQERYERNQARAAFNTAFAGFKSKAIRVIRNKAVTDGPLKGKSYAELFAVVNAVTPELAAQGLSASWRITKDEKDWIEVTCTLTHTGGHSESVSMGAMPDTGGAKNGIQARASTVTYLERYTLLAITGLAAQGTDTDGNAPRAEVEPDADGKAKLEACGSDDALKKAWAALTPEQRRTLGDVMAACKKAIREADGQ
jgi:hypothetical protein